MTSSLHLCADVGATNALLAVAAPGGDGVEILFEERYANSVFADFADLVRQFIDRCRAAVPDTARIASACLGVAGPVDRRRVEGSDFPWLIEADAIEELLDVPVILVNEFEAAAYGVDALQSDDFIALQEGDPQPRGPQLVIRAGTGLGVAYRVWAGERYIVIPGEGGHVGFAPADAIQVELWRELRKELGRVAVEHVVSGGGLLRLYEFLRAANAAPEAEAVREQIGTQDPAAAIAEHALEGEDGLSRRALDMFLECLGATAGDHALAVLARGGVYLAGVIAPKLFPRLRTGPFLPAFNGKGRCAALAARFPIRVVMTERLGLLGAAQLAARA